MFPSTHTHTRARVVTVLMWIQRYQLLRTALDVSCHCCVLFIAGLTMRCDMLIASHWKCATPISTVKWKIAQLLITNRVSNIDRDHWSGTWNQAQQQQRQRQQYTAQSPITLISNLTLRNANMQIHSIEIYIVYVGDVQRVMCIVQVAFNFSIRWNKKKKQ